MQYHFLHYAAFRSIKVDKKAKHEWQLTDTAVTMVFAVQKKGVHRCYCLCQIPSGDVAGEVAGEATAEANKNADVNASKRNLGEVGQGTCIYFIAPLATNAHGVVGGTCIAVVFFLTPIAPGWEP